jgi:hypothetical protein
LENKKNRPKPHFLKMSIKWVFLHRGGTPKDKFGLDVILQEEQARALNALSRDHGLFTAEISFSQIDLHGWIDIVF